MGIKNNDTSFSPVIRQYINLKEEYKEPLLLFRLGDFYELFFEDAEVASKVLGIILTKKNQVNNNVPMCGIPYHSAESYINRLIKEGFKVAICEQLETPEEAKKRGYKEVVKRGVVRVITRGTLIEDTLLNRKNYNYILSFSIDKKNDAVALSWLDISTGDFFVEEASVSELNNIIYRVNPKEILVSAENKKLISADTEDLTSVINEEKFDEFVSKKLIGNFFNLNNIDSLLLDTKVKLISVSILIEYLESTQKTVVSNIALPKVIKVNSALKIDAFTRKSLEIDKANAEKSNSLKSVIDNTMTSFGSRLLGEWLNNPLVNKEEINQRLDCVEYFYNNEELLESLRKSLSEIADIERITSRLLLNKGGPRDLEVLKISLSKLTEIKEKLFSNKLELLSKIVADLFYESNLLLTLQNALASSLPITVKDGGFIKKGYKADLDYLKDFNKNSVNEVLKLQENYILKTKISNLKISFNNLMGYFIEIPIKSNKDDLDETFIHKQTLAGVIRYTTNELIELESKILKSSQQALVLEQEIFKEIVEEVKADKDNIYKCAKSLAKLDVLLSFAYISKDNNYSRPVLDYSNNFIVKNGRHPVVELSLKKLEEKYFIGNDCVMDSESIFVITGPNMAGKSTFLRQNALIIILAQSGCFVPAESCHIGIFDAIYSRVGASDDLSKGQSTFMVEMLETSAILNNATEKSFIILDEIGRGTATYDGLSIAYGVLEYLHNILKSRVLFATHYHEISTLAEKLKNIGYYYMAVDESNNKIIFLHKIKEGRAQKSYGIHVAEIAGIPKTVIARAKEVLINLEKNPKVKKINIEEMPLFQENINQNDDNIKLREEINSLDVNNITPKEAIDFLYNLKNKYKN